MTEIRKVVRDGKVAVLYSPGFGAGWATCAAKHKEAMAFLPEVVDIAERKAHAEITDELVAKALGVSVKDAPYIGGAHGLEIEWVPQGCRFRIDEYDGNESVVVEGNDDGWILA